ncbi:hypothetical protein BYT27DRAFT_6775679, partial [Phlegmacium glaucopus]
EPWRAIYTPAPHLRVLDLELYDLKGVKNPSLNPLFDHNAPSLRTFHVRHLKFATHAPWLAGIRSLQIGHPFTATDLLSVLTMTPLLENLRVNDLSEGEQGAVATHPTPISLPNLNHVVLWLDVIISDALLECIIPGRGCSLSIHASRVGPASTTPNNLSKSFQTLSKYAQDFSNVHTPPFASIGICYSASSFHYKMMEKSKSKSLLEFSVSVSASFGGNLSIQMIATILNALIMPTTFKRTTELELELFDPPTADLNLGTILLSFRAIHTLVMKEWMLRYLLKLQEEDTNHILFPHLQVIKVTILNSSYFNGINGSIFRFLRSRRDAGHPIQTLDLMERNESMSPRLEYLEEMKGMKILWKTRDTKEEILEYVCGSGHPEKIPF